MICSQVDFDALFAYKVPVQAVIKDKRLGIMHYGFMFLIFLYIAVYRIGKNCDWLAKPVPKMEMRATLCEPKGKFTPIKDLPYCCPEGHFTLKDRACHISGNDEQTDGRRGCAFFSGDSVIHTQANQLTITTMRTWYERKVKTNSLGTEHKTRILYVADVENFTVMIEPNLFVSEVGRMVAGTAIKGRLFVGPIDSSMEPTASQHALCAERQHTKAPCYVTSDLPGVTTKTGNDIFKVSTLFDAMGQTLNRHRSEGVVVVFNVNVISYQDWVGLVEPYYIITLRMIPGSKYTVYNAGNWSSSNEDSTHDKGIHLTFNVEGTLAYASFTRVLLVLTTSLTLVVAAGVTVKYCAVYVFPLRKYYARIMTKEGPNQGDIEKVHKMETPLLEQKHKEVYGHVHPTKEQLVLNLLEMGAHTESEAESMLSATETKVMQAEMMPVTALPST